MQNALEHGLRDQPGEVIVRPLQRDGRLVVTVENDGEPIASDFSLGRITSLGLSIVATLVAELHGEFSMEAREGRPGTRARIDIPLG